MNFSIAAIIRRLLAPNHQISCSWLLWRRLLTGLRERGGNRRESGAFLLGRQYGTRLRIADFVLYDDLDPHCLDTGIIRFDGRHFGALWDLCKRRGLTVIADVHTHPAGCQQSDSDRAHPMISRSGHVALIVPDFAAAPIQPSEIGIFCYEGAKQWRPVRAEQRRHFFYIGL